MPAPKKWDQFTAKLVITAVYDVGQAYPLELEVSIIKADLRVDTMDTIDMLLRFNGSTIVELAIEARIRQLFLKHGLG